LHTNSNRDLYIDGANFNNGLQCQNMTKLYTMDLAKSDYMNVTFLFYFFY